MAKTLIGNVKGKDGRGISKIEKTGTTGPVDTYTITYTDSTTSTFTVNNSDSISLQRQIVPSAAIESSITASQAYEAGDYVVVSGVLRKVKSAIAKGNTISDSNSSATTATGELATIRDSVSPKTIMDGTLKKGSSMSLPTVKDWLLVGVYVSPGVTDSADKEVMVPCYVGENYILGSSGCAVTGSPRYCSVRLVLSGTSVTNEECSVHVVDTGGLFNSRQVNGIVGLIRR